MIYVFLADGFEEAEAIYPIDLLRRCGLEVITVGVTSKTVRSTHKIPITCDIELNKVKLTNDIQMIFLPGGMPGTLNLENSKEVQKAIDFCIANNIYIAAICAAPSILGHRNLLKGKHATCYAGFEKDLYGAIVSDDAVVTDGIYITSRGAGTVIEFSKVLISNLISENKANEILKSIMYK